MLLVDGCPLPTSNQSLINQLLQHPSIVSANSAFLSQDRRPVPTFPKSVCVLQGEQALLDLSLEPEGITVGSQDATTCLIVLLYCPQTSLVWTAHLDRGTCQHPALTEALQLLQQPHLYLVGSFSEPTGESEIVCTSVLRRLHASKQQVHVKLACILDGNTAPEGAPYACQLAFSVLSSSSNAQSVQPSVPTDPAPAPTVRSPDATAPKPGPTPTSSTTALSDTEHWLSPKTLSQRLHGKNLETTVGEASTSADPTHRSAAGPSTSAAEAQSTSGILEVGLGIGLAASSDVSTSLAVVEENRKVVMVRPATFADRGPELLRRMGAASIGRGPQLAQLYNTRAGCYVLPGFDAKIPSWHVFSLERMINMPHDEFLQNCSTSPLHEPAHFVDDWKCAYAWLVAAQESDVLVEDVVYVYKEHEWVLAINDAEHGEHGAGTSKAPDVVEAYA